MESCSINDFLEEINPWLNAQYIKKASTDKAGHFILHFLDGTKNIYAVDDCNERQILNVLKDLKIMGIRTEHWEPQPAELDRGKKELN